MKLPPTIKNVGLLAAAAVAGVSLVAAPQSSMALFAALGVLFASLSMKAPRSVRWAAGISILLLAVPIAGFQNSFLFELGTQMAMFAALALGLNIVVGMAGLLDLGYAAFFAIGAYTWAIFGSPQAANFAEGHFPLPGWPYFYLFIGLAILFAAIVGTLVGLPALRLRGDYLAIITMGLGQVVRLFANNLQATNGPQGITQIERPPVTWLTNLFHAVGLNVPETTVYDLFFYLLVFGIIVLIVQINVRLDHSRFGRSWVAIREDEIAARAMGVPLLRTKMLAFATGAAFSGIMGAIFAARTRFISPESFTFERSITILAMVVLGGMGSIRGAILGAGIVTLLNIEVLKSFSEWLNELKQAGTVLNLGFWKYNLADLPSQLDPTKFERLVFGLILILMMIFRPSGLIPESRHRLEMEKED